MEQINELGIIREVPSAVQSAASIPKVRHDEATKIAVAELERFLALLESLEGDDWKQPTDCDLWNVHEVAAHQAGSLKGFSSFSNIKQMRDKALIQPYLDRGMTMLEASNQAQVEMRADRTPAELIAEIREQGPRAFAFRNGLPAFFRALPLYSPDLGGLKSIGYLADTILPRDMWMHRLDICNATGREFVQTADHDGRIAALVVRDLAQVLKPILGQASVIFELAGAAGGSWHIGKNSVPSATLTMDVLDFNVLASGRAKADVIRSQQRVSLRGDKVLCHKVLEQTNIPY